ncbi:MAG TPA: cation/H(+) antiporter [Prolixibacteraceae bacterium]|nr:cation/H(+) antiporter [Prolixibacteraceae bacterium]
MKKIKDTLLYIGILGVFFALMYWIIQSGKILEAGRFVVEPQLQSSYFSQFIQSIANNLAHPVGLVLAQIVTIIIVSRVFGFIFRKIHQPTVIGEIIAGIALGPSLLGILFPEFSSSLFPENSLGNLSLLSQVGLILFMFMVGMELDMKVIQSKVKDAVVVSNAGILIPFTIGIGLAYFIYENFAPKGVPFLSFGLFLGMAMSITAFPVLARIVQERGMHRTRVGNLVITCAAADDITAWCMLAAIIAIAKAGSFVSSLYVILLSIGYVLIMIKVVRPFLKRVGDLHATRENLSKQVVAIFFLTLLISSYTTEIIGIHALFGAFLAGTIMPENTKFRNIFIQKIEDVALVLLLPLFFVFTGLRTQIGLLNDIYLWKITGLIILVAITGKFVGSALAAKFVGQNWRDSLTIGALMNTRGLMELIVLNIGYDLGILSPEVFSMMVIMALVTTLMTGPALDLIERIFRTKPDMIQEKISHLSKFKIILSFGNPEMGRSLLRLANNLVKKQKENTSVTALHLCPNNVLHHYNMDEYENESFEPVIQESELLSQKITTLFKASDDIDHDITEITNKGDFDLLLIGIGQSIFEGSLLGKILGYTTRIVNPDRLIHRVAGKEKIFGNSPFDDRTQNILSASKVPVGIFVDKNTGDYDQVIVPFYTEKDGFLVDYIQRLIKNSGAQVTATDPAGTIRKHIEIKEAIRAIEQEAPNHITVNREKDIDEEFIRQFQLMVISTDGWKKLVDSQCPWLNQTPSILILKA